MAEAKEIVSDVSIERLARIYAEALLNAAQAAGEVDTVLEEIDSVVDGVISDERLLAMIAGAMLGRNARRDVLVKVFSGKASKTFYHFLLVLNDKDRLDMIRPIRRAIHELQDERTRRLRVHVYSAVDLSEEYLARIREGIQNFFKLEPVLILHVDKNLLGGLKVRIGDTVYDSTVRTRLNNLRNQLMGKGSHEIQSRRDSFSTAE
jgi:F-type H+-transporting ATPase subunit delta